jgi:hypothetical protein
MKGVPGSELTYWSAPQVSPPFIYKKPGQPKGVRLSTHSVNPDGELFEKTVVVKDIKRTLCQEFCCYGYRNMAGELKELRWIINHKKVYRLMKEHKLLYRGRMRPEPFKEKFYPLQKSLPGSPIAVPVNGYQGCAYS